MAINDYSATVLTEEQREQLLALSDDLPGLLERLDARKHVRDKEACSFQVEWAAKGKALSLTPYDIGLPGIDGEVELGPKAFMENILYPFQTSLWVYMVALMMTLLLFSYRLADLNPTHGRYGLSVQAASTCSRDEKQVAQLVKAWGWSRPAVLAFVDQLQKYEILEVCNMVTSKVVHLKPSIFSSGLSPTPGG